MLASREDQPCTVQEASVAWRHVAVLWERYVRISRTHPLLDAFKTGKVGRETEDGREATAPSDRLDITMVPKESSPPLPGAVSAAPAEAARPLCLLRDPGQLRPTEALPPGSSPNMAELAGTPKSVFSHQLEAVRAVGEEVSVTTTPNRPQHDPTQACRAAKLCTEVVPRLQLPRNRMSELFTYGSVGGPAGNRRPYPEGYELSPLAGRQSELRS